MNDRRVYEKKLPSLYPVITKKVSSVKSSDMISICNDLFIANILGININQFEFACLTQCSNKNIEMDKFIRKESFRIFVTDVKKFLKRDGV